jgi:hypothetical protein
MRTVDPWNGVLAAGALGMGAVVHTERDLHGALPDATAKQSTDGAGSRAVRTTP